MNRYPSGRFGWLVVAWLIIVNSVASAAHAETRSVRTAQELKPMAPRLFAQAGSSDFPILPGAPFGPSLPLPPLPQQGTVVEAPVKTAEVGNLVEGEGQYRGFVLVTAGPFEMGGPEGQGRSDEQPLHKVFLKEFYIAKHEVTTKEYCHFLNQQGLMGKDKMPKALLSSSFCPVSKTGDKFEPKPGTAERPMVCVSWFGAADYAQWAGGRLPTSAEWEKAALFSTPQPAGDFLTVLSRSDDVPVSLAQPGTHGISGMVGNVWEWCSDWYAPDYYSRSSVANPMGPPLGEERVIRGGSWASPESSRRISNIHRAPPHGFFRTVGFRIVKD